MVQNITGSRHKGGPTLDLVITRRNSPPTGYRVDPPVYSDHSLLLCAFPPMNFAVHHKSKNVRFWKHLDRDSFRKSLLGSQLCGCADTLSTMSPSALFDLYDGTLRHIVDEHLQVEEVSVRDRSLTSDDRSQWKPQRHWSTPSYQVAWTTATVFSTEPRTLSCKGCNPFSTRRPGWSRTQGNLTTSRLCSGINFIGFPFTNASSSKLQPLFEIHSMVVAWHISVDPASPFRKSGREPTFVLRHGDTSPHLTTPGHVASGQEASVSPNRLCGTPCPKTSQI